MNHDPDIADDGMDELPPELAALLARPESWDDDLPPDLEDLVVAAVVAEAGQAAPAAPAAVATTPPPPQPIDLTAVRARRQARWTTSQLLTAVAAAAVLVIAGVLALSWRGGDDAGGTTVAIGATEIVPAASAEATFTSTPSGLKIVLDTDQLPGAQPGEMYEAWISDGEIRVSCGTFHMRGGDNPIELWAGTADPAFRIFTVTIEPIDGVAESSGQVVLKGEFTLAED